MAYLLLPYLDLTIVNQEVDIHDPASSFASFLVYGFSNVEIVGRLQTGDQCWADDLATRNPPPEVTRLPVPRFRRRRRTAALEGTVIGDKILLPHLAAFSLVHRHCCSPVHALN